MEFPSNALPWKAPRDAGVEYRVAEQPVGPRHARRHRREGRRANARRGRLLGRLSQRVRLPASKSSASSAARRASSSSWTRSRAWAPCRSTSRRRRSTCSQPTRTSGCSARRSAPSSTSARTRATGCPPPFLGWWNIQADEEQSFLAERWQRAARRRRLRAGLLCRRRRSRASTRRSACFRRSEWKTVRGRILGLVGALREGLAARGWRITTPEPLASGILSAVPPSGDARAMAKALEQRGVIVAPREGAVRFSPHVGNDLRRGRARALERSTRSESPGSRLPIERDLPRFPIFPRAWAEAWRPELYPHLARQRVPERLRCRYA